ncbi:MarR family winged helix-turn-helix transcriptional regulator [Ktedonosporobacter rubrisoli]|nr:MarR family transcriptional regulator [Ktedonosporobacter rubrisoli]
MEKVEPMIGALLRYGWQRVMKTILSELPQEGFTDLQQAHVIVFLYPGPEGLSPGALAERHGMSKQAMNQLLHSLEQLGYLTRGVDPHNRRARIIQLTERGERVVAVARRKLVLLEQEWAAQLGEERFAALKQMLQELRRLPERL